MRRSNALIGLLSLVPIGSALIPSAHISLFATRGLQLQQQRHYSNNDCCLTTYNTISTKLDMRTRRRRRRRVRRGRHNHDSDGIAVTDDEKSAIFLEDCDHTGIAKSIEAEYAAEEEKLGMSFWEVLERERERPLDQISKKSRDMSPWDRTKRRMNYAKGNVENKYTAMTERKYGTEELLDQNHLTNPPSLDDINQKQAPFKDRYWSAPVFRISVIAASYFAFPLFLRIFVDFQTIDPEDFDTIVGQIAPNVGVLYATLLALTLQVLYDRFTRIQENVTTEAMLLSQVTRNLISLFANEPDWAKDSLQLVANQVRIIISRTRGVELLSIMKADTYSNLLNIVDDYHYLHGADDDYSAQEESLTGMLRGEIAQLMETRALRLSDEASSLPPTHFLLITSLSFVSIVAYVTASYKVIEDIWHPPQEASLLFAGLLSLYILFFNFCKDLNGPFAGVYQIKRSNAISHLMQVKWLIVNQFGDDIDFNSNYGEGEASGEDINKVEEDTMKRLVRELETTEQVIEQEGDLCDSDLPIASSLYCTTDDRLERLHQMKAELEKLKGHSDPESRLSQIQKELTELKQQPIEMASSVNTTMEPSEKLLQQAEETYKQEESKIAEEAASKQIAEQFQQRCDTIEAMSMPLKDKATGVQFDPKLDDGLYLVGVGVRKKAIINVYAVGVYSSPSVMEALSPYPKGKQKQEAQTALNNAARTFSASSPKTSFVLEMTFNADAATIAGAIADSIKPRYDGSDNDIKVLETLIVDGIKSKGGKANKGTILRFDCSEDGVSVSIDGVVQGIAAFNGLGSSFVDVFLDDKAVSPQLVDSCLNTWCVEAT